MFFFNIYAKFSRKELGKNLKPYLGETSDYESLVTELLKEWSTFLITLKLLKNPFYFFTESKKKHKCIEAKLWTGAGIEPASFSFQENVLQTNESGLSSITIWGDMIRLCPGSAFSRNEKDADSFPVPVYNFSSTHILYVYKIE